jgi:hypothetical protein
MPDHSKYDAPRYEATVGGTWPNGKDFAAGDTIAADRIPEADKHRLIQRGVFVPLWPKEPAEKPAETEAQDAAD